MKNNPLNSLTITARLLLSSYDMPSYFFTEKLRHLDVLEAETEKYAAENKVKIWGEIFHRDGNYLEAKIDMLGIEKCRADGKAAGYRNALEMAINIINDLADRDQKVKMENDVLVRRGEYSVGMDDRFKALADENGR
jgi:hypothetical protein